jgi:hypothetical protein
MNKAIEVILVISALSLTACGGGEEGKEVSINEIDTSAPLQRQCRLQAMEAIPATPAHQDKPAIAVFAGGAWVRSIVAT